MSKTKLTKKERYNLYLEKQKKHQQEIDDAYERAIIVVLYTSILYLRDQKGYGKKRLGDFVEGFFEILEDISNDYLDFNDIFKVIKEETGIQIKQEDIHE